jgi:hypothetical protein
MVALINQDFSMLKQFDNDEKLWLYLQRQAKLGEHPPEKPDEKWGFVYYPYQMLKDCLEIVKDENCRSIVYQAVEQKQHIIVIYHGRRTPFCVPVAPGVDTAQLKRDWCKVYAKNHGFHVVIG